MAGFSGLSNFWNTVKEVDLRPLRDQALRPVRIVLVGEPDSGVEELAKRMVQDPARPELETLVNLPILTVEQARHGALSQLAALLAQVGKHSELGSRTQPNASQQYLTADLWVLVIQIGEESAPVYKELVQVWSQTNRNVVVFFNSAPENAPAVGTAWLSWGQRRVVYGSVQDTQLLLGAFAAAILDLLPDKHLSLGRHYPLLRVPAARRLINDTCVSNAAYSISTGVAEVVPVLGVPLYVTDMVVLTKNQAYLVYKLGLTLGMSTDWQAYIAEFGSVLGTGFIWRQVARSLVGLVPAWGIVPKVAVAYSGTYVVGNAVLQWYLTGRHVSKGQMKALYSQAFERGKDLAARLAAHLPHPRLPKRKNVRRLPAQRRQNCPLCGKENSAEAVFCQFCGERLGPPPASI